MKGGASVRVDRTRCWILACGDSLRVFVKDSSAESFVSSEVDFQTLRFRLLGDLERR